MKNHKPNILITGASGQIGSAVLRHLQANAAVNVIAALRSPVKAQALERQGIRTVLLDFDRPATLAPALAGVDRVFLVTGYTVGMLRQSKVFLDAAKAAGVRHIVHLGACGRDDTTVAHWAWHQLVERYIEWQRFGYTHLRPECFMQNLLGYGGVKTVERGLIRHFTGHAAFSWVDGEDVALAAALALMQPEKHEGKTYRLGYDAQSYDDIARIMTAVLGQEFRSEALSPDLFRESMRASGADMAYMECVAEHYADIAAHAIPGLGETFDNFPDIAGREPMRLEAFIRKHRAAFAYPAEAR